MNLPLLAAWLGAAAVWLFAGLGRQRQRAALASHLGVFFALRRDMRLLGLLLILGSVAMLAFPVFVPPAQAQRGDWLIALLLGGVFGLNSVIGMLFWRGRIQVSAQGLRAWSVWGVPHVVAWEQVREVAISDIMQSYRFDTACGRFYVPLFIERLDDFRALLERHLAADKLPKTRPATDAEAMHAAYLADLARWAPRGLPVVLFVVGLSSLILPPVPAGMGLAAAAGLMLALSGLPLSRFDSRLRGGLRFVSLAGFAFLSQRSAQSYQEHLLQAGQEVMDGYQGLLVLLQTLGFALCITLSCLILARRFLSDKLF